MVAVGSLTTLLMFGWWAAGALSEPLTTAGEPSMDDNRLLPTLLKYRKFTGRAYAKDNPVDAWLLEGQRREPSNLDENAFPFDLRVSQRVSAQSTLSYSIVDGVAYLAVFDTIEGVFETAECADSLSVSSLPSALEQAFGPLSHSDSPCDSEASTYWFQFDGDSFFVCISEEELGRVAVHVVGDSMIVELHGYTVLGSDPIRAPAIPDTPPLSCEPTTAPTQPIYPDDPSRHLRSCGSCADGKKKCLFFHGAGVKVDSKKLLTQYPLYWGSDILDSAPCCSSIRFARFNTYNTAWTDEILQTKFCNAMLNYDDDDTSPDETVVNDLIVVTHSMAGLVMGLALNSSRCELASSSKWVSIAAPMAGSNSADHISALCQQDDGSNSLSLLTPVLELTGQCPVAPTFNYFYKEGSPTAVDKGLDDYYAQAQDGFVQNVYAVMCGTSPFGLSSAYSPALALISSISKHSGDDDGLVEIASCSAGLDDARFSSSYTSRFYSASINHVDATFRNGDGFFGDGRKPLKWFSCLF